MDVLRQRGAGGVLEDRPDRTGVVGPGRSVFSVVDRDLIAHVLDRSRAGARCTPPPRGASAELFSRLLPLLIGRGIRTVGEAREAARQSYHARVDEARYRQLTGRSPGGGEHRQATD
ncbi:MAG TPA: hypothetical protein VGJ95_02770 [Pseudonocardiaceae bacterium]